MHRFKSLSIFQNVSKDDIILKPSPHIIVKNCLDDTLYKELSESFPSDFEFSELFKACNNNKAESLSLENVRLSLHAIHSLNNQEKISSLWIDFIEYHTSDQFLKEVNTLFGDYVYQYCPSFQKKIGSLDTIDTQVRYGGNYSQDKLSMECQFSLNTPSSHESSVIGAHTDGLKELYAGLLYFRNNQDKAQGGDLIVYEWIDPKKKRFTNASLVDCHYIKEVNRIKYEPNTLVFFLNTKDFIHSVSPRKPSEYSRRFVNILSDISLEKMPEGLYSRSYSWSLYKAKLLARSILSKIGVLRIAKTILSR